MQLSFTLSVILASFFTIQIALCRPASETPAKPNLGVSFKTNTNRIPLCKPCKADQGCDNKANNTFIGDGYSVEAGFVYFSKSEQDYWMVKLETGKFLSIVNICPSDTKSKLFQIQSFTDSTGKNFDTYWYKVGCNKTCIASEAIGDDMTLIPKYVSNVAYYSKAEELEKGDGKGKGKGKKTSSKVKGTKAGKDVGQDVKQEYEH